ncbi:hypothetical protein INS49_015604 [Diaporthe citri]|uniref:uncharacterized protein n=1 Tax=Diaporthe citri TaxID=83186 RepID=UPI001C810186|nr:uncharacterized protein INS49_015604 [Diaporthe citri]KAG6356217.1 hypothetical protein INS49_015604 [Diaporthe citri]
MAAPSSMTGLIGMFDLAMGGENMPVGGSILQESTEESVFDPDFRVAVDPSQYQDGGIYRSIVKLQMRYDGQGKDSTGWYMGTGWLISPDIMVTAGHNVYNWASDGLGKATIIKCHIGYKGKESIGSPGVQTRHAKRCVTSAEWLASKDNRHRDFAFIQVDKPFTGNLRLFSYGKTPPHGYEMLGVVGYPGDQSIKDSYGRAERGAEMYKEFDKVQYDLTTSKANPLGMLTYRISTYGGQSGSPVIREGTQTGIATHVYGLGDKNQASPITDYDNFFSAFKQNLPQAGEVDGITLHKTIGRVGAESILGDSFNIAQPVGKSLLGINVDSEGNSDQYTLRNNNASEQEQSFSDVFKNISSVISNVGEVVFPIVETAMLGQAGAPVAAIAHAALGALGNACESTQDTDSSKVMEGAPERGALAESALQAVVKLQKHNPSHPVLQKIHADMAQSYGQVAPAIPQLAEQLKPALIKGAAIVGQTDYIPKNKFPRSTGGQRLPIQSTILGAESARGLSDFEECILGDTKVVNGEEAFFENVGNFLAEGLQVAKPLLRKDAVAGLKAIATRLAASREQESALDRDESSGESQAAKLVVQRAVMGESALQALRKLDSRELNSLTVPSEGGSAHEEPIGDFFNTSVQTIGGVVKTVAPVILNNVLPAVIKAVQGSGQESAPESIRTGLSARKPSRFQMYDEHQGSTRNQGFLSVSALLPSHGLMTADHVREAHEIAPLPTRDSNEDLPVYEEYD